MDLVDKEDDFVFDFRCFIDHLFEASLELTSILGTRDHEGEID